MKFISEENINKILDDLGTDQEHQTKALETLKQQQPIILAYLFTENFNAFLPKEKEYLLYLLLVIWETAQATRETLPQINDEQLSKAEEYNWSLLQDMENKRFRDRLDVFFQQTRQEDLLAFIEDALIDEEEGFVSKEAREPMFVTLKSIMDCLDGFVIPETQN
ncbi:MAG: hypothetical protein HRU40_17490 [Saprospiraceae bacterium]|nr:hypothetical protein [Saprospiraceae bacterium]